MPAATVKFNVGGRVFEMLREPTLSLHPESVLCQMADEWDGREPIFVEANPDLFQYIVDYHRHRKIYLPAAAPKAAVIREAAVLGLTLTDADIEQDLPGLDAIAGRGDHLKNATNKLKSDLLAHLVMSQAMGKAATAGGPSFQIRLADLCSAGAGKSVRLRGSEGEVNAFRYTLEFLLTGVDKKSHEDALNSMARREGYRVSIDNWRNLDDLCYCFAAIQCSSPCLLGGW